MNKDITNFLDLLGQQVNSSRKKKDIDKPVMTCIGKNFDNRTIECESKLKKGMTAVQYFAYHAAKAGVKREVALDFVVKRFGSSYPNQTGLEAEFDAMFSTTQFDEEHLKRNYGFLLDLPVVSEFPKPTLSSSVNKMPVKLIEKLMLMLIGGWRKWNHMKPGEKQFDAIRRGLEMFEWGLTEEYVCQYLSMLVDGDEIKETDVLEMARVAREAAVRKGTLNSKHFNRGGYYK